MISPAWAASHLQSFIPVQGNLDPVRLLAGGRALDDGLAAIEAGLNRTGGWIFNLGHGVIKETPPENVGRVKDIVRGWSVHG
jgi:uroporphyrinogen decarboxylase